MMMLFVLTEKLLLSKVVCVCLFVVVLLLSCHASLAQAMPSFRANTYHESDIVKLRVNRLTSLQSLFPLPPYSLPFCEPQGGVKRTRQNLGQHLAGDSIQTSPYRLFFKKDLYCEHLCISFLGRPEREGRSHNRMVDAIRKGYAHNWLIDGLPAAYKKENDDFVSTKFAGGVPLGYVSQSAKLQSKAYVYNHVNIEIMYHPLHHHHHHDHDDENEKQGENSPEEDAQEYRVVRVTVQPFSIRHQTREYTQEEVEAGANKDNNSLLPKLAKLADPIPSCDPNQHAQFHTSYDMVTTDSKASHQLASGRVLFTYDVIWMENIDLHWADRWDDYLSAGGMNRKENHWFSTIVSLVLLLVLSSMILTLLSHNLRRDFSRYNRVATDEEKEVALEEYGWKLVHADVFRPPKQPLWLAVMSGTGTQVLATSIICLAFGATGMIQPMHRGRMVVAQLVVFSLMGIVNGMVTGYLYKSFDGQVWKVAAIAAAYTFSGLAFVVFFVTSCMADALNSTMKIPFGALLLILLLWLGVCTPLTFLGTWIGFLQRPIEYPVNTAKNPRPIPKGPWYTSLPFTILVAGLFPFAPCFLEIYMTMCSVWLDAYNPFYGFFFFIALCALLLAAEITVLLTYFQLVREDYQWWWRSFVSAGATAIYIFGYTMYYHGRHLEADNHLPSWFLYYSYMSVACLGLFCAMGVTGLISSLIFCRGIFSSVKID